MKFLCKWAIVMAFVSLGGCGGGNSASTPQPGSVLRGVAATGAAISGRIFIKDSTGQERFVDTTDGYFSFPLDGLTAPFMLKALWTENGQPKTLYSVASQSGTANITPITAVVVQAASRTTALDTVYAAAAQNLGALVAAIPAATVAIEKSLKSLLASFGLQNVDPITGTFAPNHTGMDALLDTLRIGSSGANIALVNKVSGALIMQAPAAHVNNALSIPDWSAQQAVLAYHPDIAVNSAGTGLVVWAEMINGHNAIRARLLDGAASTPVTLSSTPDSDSDAPQVVFDANGNAVVVWLQYTSPLQTTWARRYSASNQTWSAPVQLSDPAQQAAAAGAVVAVDASGNAVVSWTQGNGVANHYDVWAARFNVAQASWSAPGIVSDGVNSAHDSHVAINASGQGLLSWVQDQGSGSVSNGPMDIWGLAISTSAAWTSTPTRLNSIPGSSSHWLDVYASLAVDAAGNGVALWVQNTTSGVSEVNAAMYAVTGGWQTSSVITHSTISGFRFPQVAFDGLGNAFAAWREMPLAGGWVGSASRYVAGAGWGSTYQFANNTNGDVYDVRAAVDGQGNATLVWYQWQLGATPSVYSTRYLIDTGWGSVDLISPTTMDGSMTCPAPRVGASATGQTVTIWGFSDNTC